MIIDTVGFDGPEHDRNSEIITDLVGKLNQHCHYANLAKSNKKQNQKTSELSSVNHQR